MNEGDEDRQTPAEARLAGYLDGLRAGEPAQGDGFAASLVRTARWQRAARHPLRLAGALLGAFGDGLGLLARASRAADR
jgi:hypothetical protein